MFLRSITDTLAGLVTGLLATCPMADDVTSGIVFEDHLTRYTMLYAHKDMGGGIYWSSFSPALSEDLWQSFKFGGLLEIQTMRNSGASLKQVDYPVAPATLFPLVPGAVHQFVSKHKGRNGMDFDWRYTLKVAERVEVVIGGCTYQGPQLEWEQNGTRSDGYTSRRIERLVWLEELRYPVELNGKGETQFERVRALRKNDPFRPQPVSDHVRRYASEGAE